MKHEPRDALWSDEGKFVNAGGARINAGGISTKKFEQGDTR